MSSTIPPVDVSLRVLYDFEYATRDDRKVCIAEGERLFLIKKTNPDWWQVIRSSRERPFFVPAKYVEIFDADVVCRDNDLPDHQDDASPEPVDCYRNGSVSSPARPGAFDESPSELSRSNVDMELSSPSSDDVRRILFDKRKSWAVEELLSELTQGRSAPEPAPEPEPDYETLLDEDNNVVSANVDNPTAALGKHCLVLSRDGSDKIDLSSSRAGIETTATSDKNTDNSRAALSEAEFQCVGSDKQLYDASRLQGGLFKVPRLPESKDCRVSVVLVDNSSKSALAKSDSVKSNSGSTFKGNSRIYSNISVVTRNSDCGTTDGNGRSVVAKADSVKSNNTVSAIGNARVYSNVSLVKRDSVGSECDSQNGSSKRDSVRSDTGSVDSRGSYARVTLVDDARGSRVNVNNEGLVDDVLTRSVRSKKGPKVTQLSESLERLAQQIQFTTEKPAATAWAKKPSRSHDEEFLSRSHDNLDVSDQDVFCCGDEKLKTYPDKMFLKVKNKIQHSGSFKTKKEMEKVVRKKRYGPEPDTLGIRASVSGDVMEIAFDKSRIEKDDAAQEDKVQQKEGDEANLLLKEEDHGNRAQKDKNSVSVMPKEMGKTFNLWRKEKDKILSAVHKGVDANSQKAKDTVTQQTQETATQKEKEVVSQKEKEVVPQKEEEIASQKEKRKQNEIVSENENEKQKEIVSHKEKEDVRPTVKELQKTLQGMSSDDRERRTWRDILMETRDGDPALTRSSRDHLDTIGEATILRDDHPATATSPVNLNHIAVGFQNPAYRPNSHSLDDFHDPAVLAMHDKLCTALGERHDIAPTESKSSRWGRLRQLSQEGDDTNKTRNFFKLKTAIEKASTGHTLPDISVEHVGAGGGDDRKASDSLDELVFGGSRRGDERSRSGSNTSDDAGLDGGRRKTSLSRTGRVESIRERQQLKLLPILRPPSPCPGDLPTKTLGDDWAQYHTQDGRTYYYCSATGEKSWKPPRKQGLNSESEDGNSSPTLGITVPHGWQEGMDNESGLPTFTHHSGAKWYSSSDAEGRLYFFEEHSANSSWTLPSIPGSEANSPTATTTATTTPTTVATVATTAASTTTAVTTTTHTSPAAPPAVKPNIASIVNSLMAEKRRDEQAVMRLQLDGKPNNRLLKTRSMVLVPPTYDDKSPTLAPPNWPHLFEGNMKIVREGPIYRTKITEHGKKVRKNWSQSYVVLTELFLLFYNDIKHAIAMKNGVATAPPELCIDLSGANIERADKLSSRKNVFVVSTQLGHQVLIQCDSSKTGEQWYHSIHTVIALLPRNENSPILLKSSPDVVKKPSRLGYSRSMRMKKEGSMEDLTANPDERQTKIRARLKKFFVRRPTKESLVKKGIYKDEPMFGRNLSDVIPNNATVPQFVVHCIDVIESKEENMKADGLYRVSGNLSQVQKIRLQADQNNLNAIDQEEDVHVLTGALKLFFRELKTPLIPCEHFSKALKASSNPNKKERMQQFRDIVKALPAHNRSTLQYLLQHLLRVAKYKEFNRMHIPNVAIVFGPSLMWPEEEELGNMAIDLMQQNLVVECLLVDFDQIFR